LGLECSSCTSTKELMIDSQWISKLCGRKEYCAYLVGGREWVEIVSREW
jgi:hypothetical protein